MESELVTEEKKRREKGKGSDGVHKGEKKERRGHLMAHVGETKEREKGFCGCFFL